MPPEPPPPADFRQFWDHYLAQHRDPRNVGLHVAGTLLGLTRAAVGLAPLLGGRGPRWRWLLAAPVVGYGLAWAGHFLVEGNRPATFGRPAWSLRADLKLLARTLTGRGR